MLLHLQPDPPFFLSWRKKLTQAYFVKYLRVMRAGHDLLESNNNGSLFPGQYLRCTHMYVALKSDRQDWVCASSDDVSSISGVDRTHMRSYARAFPLSMSLPLNPATRRECQRFACANMIWVTWRVLQASFYADTAQPWEASLGRKDNRSTFLSNSLYDYVWVIFVFE